MGKLAGRPVCTFDNVEYQTVHKIAGALQLVADLPQGVTLESPKLPDTLKAIFAGILKINVDDFKTFIVSYPVLRVAYEFIVPDASRADEIVNTLTSLETELGLSLLPSQTNSATSTLITVLECRIDSFLNLFQSRP